MVDDVEVTSNLPVGEQVQCNIATDGEVLPQGHYARRTSYLSSSQTGMFGGGSENHREACPALCPWASRLRTKPYVHAIVRPDRDER